MDRGIQTSIAAGLARITINRPEKRNALDRATIVALTAALERCDSDSAARLTALLGTLDSLSKPTLARVNGDGYGGALGLLGACDIVIAAIDAKFAFTEVRLGIIPAVISPFVLAEIGESAARRYFLTAETITAERLKELRLGAEGGPARGTRPQLERTGGEAALA